MTRVGYVKPQFHIVYSVHTETISNFTKFIRLKYFSQNTASDSMYFVIYIWTSNISISAFRNYIFVQRVCIVEFEQFITQFYHKPPNFLNKNCLQLMPDRFQLKYGRSSTCIFVFFYLKQANFFWYCASPSAWIWILVLYKTDRSKNGQHLLPSVRDLRNVFATIAVRMKS